MHAGVRWLIEHDPTSTWDPQWGRPINQEDMLETLLTFTEVVFEVFDRTGVVYSDDDAEAYLHVWSYVGFLLGVDPNQLPLTRTDTKTLMAAVRSRQFGASAAGVILMDALLEEGRKLTPPGLRGLPASTVRFFVGDTTADYLSVPPSDWTKVFFGPLKRLTRALVGREGASRPVAQFVGPGRHGDAAAGSVGRAFGTATGLCHPDRAGRPMGRVRLQGPLWDAAFGERGELRRGKGRVEQRWMALA